MRISFLVEVDDEEQLPETIWLALVKARAGFRCEDCGGTEDRIDSHHLNGDHADNRLVNGQALCTRCHGRVTNVGRVLSEDHKEKLRRAALGRPHTNEEKELIRQGMRAS